MDSYLSANTHSPIPVRGHSGIPMIKTATGALLNSCATFGPWEPLQTPASELMHTWVAHRPCHSTDVMMSVLLQLSIAAHFTRTHIRHSTQASKQVNNFVFYTQSTIIYNNIYILYICASPQPNQRLPIHLCTTILTIMQLLINNSMYWAVYQTQNSHWSSGSIPLKLPADQHNSPFH